MEERRKRGHRHGDGRAALLGAAAALLEEGGASTLSLRGVAERAGLSRQAPYNHFADKEAMLAELVADGFHRLTSELRAAAAGKVGMAALAGMGEAYTSFGQQTPSLFRLMFARELVDHSCFPAAADAGSNAFGAMAEVVATLCPPDRVHDVSIAAWCLIHGYTTLRNETGLDASEWFAERMQQFSAMVAFLAAA